VSIDEIMRAAPVIPVLVLEGDGEWASLADTFVGADLPVLEVTLRTPGALQAIRHMREVPGAIVGAGTVVNQRQLDEALAAGAQFIVSPGLTEPLARAAERMGVAYLPGIATAGDVMRGLDLGLDRFKFFPAESSGGIAGLKALSGPFADVRFCPTGGIGQESADEWLALNAVLCVGGSWLYRSGDSMDTVRKRARAAAALRDRTSR
jgi:2-dehydro-3-deoxyphosphogluconate aldolase/(4S)-4-hydroxy-2-oxoglutarate aldolase